MFEYLYTAPETIAQYRDAPPLEERLKSLDHCAVLGNNIESLRAIGINQLVPIRILDLQERERVSLIRFRGGGTSVVPSRQPTSHDRRIKHERKGVVDSFGANFRGQRCLMPPVSRITSSGTCEKSLRQCCLTTSIRKRRRESPFSHLQGYRSRHGFQTLLRDLAGIGRHEHPCFESSLNLGFFACLFGSGFGCPQSLHGPVHRRAGIRTR